MIRSYFRYGLATLGISIFMITISLSFQTIIGLPAFYAPISLSPGPFPFYILKDEVIYSVIILVEAWGLGFVIPSLFLLSWGATYDDPSEIKGSHTWYVVSLFFLFGGIISSGTYLLIVVLEYI